MWECLLREILWTSTAGFQEEGVVPLYTGSTYFCLPFIEIFELLGMKRMYFYIDDSINSTYLKLQYGYCRKALQHPLQFTAEMPKSKTGRKFSFIVLQ